MGTVKHLRVGFSVNSSSDHSIVFIPKDSNWTNDLADLSTDYFGWENFKLISPDMKLKYLASNLYQSIYGKIGKDAAKAVVEVWTGVKPDQDGNIPEVDHQSQLTLPTDWEGKCADREFFQALTAYVLRDDIAILGGNDNEENGNDKYVPALDLNLTRAYSSVCRKENGYWIVFDRGSGDKIRVDFSGSLTPRTVPKPFTPELVDLKITDWCDKGCGFCYQGSTAKGKHADFKIIQELINDLAECKVFEVAIGGGEPTAHPDFVAILKYCRDCHIVPNFTTKSTKWLENELVSSSIIELMGSFAYSVSSAKEAEDFITLFRTKNDEYDWKKYPAEFSFNYALGTADKEEFIKLAEVCIQHNITLNILGYKSKGRAGSFVPYDSSTWLNDYIATYDRIHSYRAGDNRHLSLGIDTMVAQQYEAQLKAHKVSNVFYDVQEGKFSMYIDAVKGLVGPSSYGKLEVYFAENNIKKYFDQY